MIEGVVRIDAQRVPPRNSSLLNETHLAVARSEQNAGDIRVRVASYPTSKQVNRVIVFTQLKACLSLEVQELVCVRVEGDSTVETFERLLGQAGIVQAQAE